MCNTKPNCQTRLKAEQYEQEIAKLKERVNYYQTKQIAISDELLALKFRDQGETQTIENIIAIITNSN